MAARPRFPVAVIGPGALGLLYASRLSQVVPTALIARSASRARALRAVRVGARRYRPAVFGPDNLPLAELAIILVKGYDTPAALSLARALRAKRVLSLQNGLIEAVPQGVSTAGAHRRGDAVVVATTGETLLPRGFTDLATWLRQAGMSARVSADIDRARYLKLLANVCINPLTALFRIRNGEVRKAPYAALTTTLAKEAARVLGISSRTAVQHVMKVALATAANRSSMLQDVEAQRRTEIHQLTGALLHIARRRRVEAPTHRAVLRLISVIERGLESVA
jgi:2-dehydropantoate 2-reductase